jgi:hypothetical protein
MKSTSLARASSSAACLLLLVTLPSRAQETEPASLRFVNATGAREPLTVHVNGGPLQARGYHSSEATGRLELAAGPCHIELHHPRLGHVILPLELHPGDARIVVALSEPAQGAAERRQPPKLTSQVLVQPPPDPPGQRRLQVLQATPLEQLDLSLSGQELRCRRRRVESLVVKHPQPLLEQAGQALGRLPFDEAGNGTLILFCDTAGQLRRVFFLEPASATGASDRE